MHWPNVLLHPLGVCVLQRRRGGRDHVGNAEPPMSASVHRLELEKQIHRHGESRASEMIDCHGAVLHKCMLAECAVVLGSALVVVAVVVVAFQFVSGCLAILLLFWVSLF